MADGVEFQLRHVSQKHRNPVTISNLFVIAATIIFRRLLDRFARGSGGECA